MHRPRGETTYETTSQKRSRASNDDTEANSYARALSVGFLVGPKNTHLGVSCCCCCCCIPTILAGVGSSGPLQSPAQIAQSWTSIRSFRLPPSHAPGASFRPTTAARPWEVPIGERLGGTLRGTFGMICWVLRGLKVKREDGHGKPVTKRVEPSSSSHSSDL